MKFLIVDDHVLIREAMRGVLAELAGDALLLEAATAASAMATVEKHPDIALVLLDLRLPDRDGFDVLAALRQQHPAVPVVMLSAFNDRESVTKALDHGAQGFIPKTDSREILLMALRLVLAGGIYIPPDVLGRPQPSPVPVAAAPVAEGPASRRPTPAELGLTDRQVDVLALIMQGKSNKLICRALNLAEPTVKNHVSAILKALDVTNRTAAVVAVAALGWELPKRD